MNEKVLKFTNIRLNKKEYHKSKQAIDLSLVMMVLNILLVTKKVKLLNRCVSFYHK